MHIVQPEFLSSISALYLIVIGCVYRGFFFFFAKICPWSYFTIIFLLLPTLFFFHTAIEQTIFIIFFTHSLLFSLMNVICFQVQSLLESQSLSSLHFLVLNCSFLQIICEALLVTTIFCYSGLLQFMSGIHFIK